MWEKPVWKRDFENLLARLNDFIRQGSLQGEKVTEVLDLHSKALERKFEWKIVLFSNILVWKSSKHQTKLTKVWMCVNMKDDYDNIRLSS